MVVLALALASTLLQAAPDARQVTLGAPQSIVELDTGRLKGDVARLAWSPDGSEFYIQTVERDRAGAIKSTHHYLASPASIKDTSQEPAWGAKYWDWKSAQGSPAASTFRIAVDGPRKVTRRSTSAPTGGVLAKGGTADPTAGTTLEDVASVADQSQTVIVYTLKVRNETIGEWANEAVTPGVNFTWAPAPLPYLAYTKRDGGPIVVLDESGHHQELAGAKAATLPAWSSDGRRIAWLERQDRKKYRLTVADVTVR